MAMITAFKCTRANGRDFRTNTVEYVTGAVLEVADADAQSKASCGRGLHISPTAKMTCRYGERAIDRGKWRWFEVSFDERDLLGKDDTKYRVRRLTVGRELTIVDVFGGDFAGRIAKCNDESATWKDIKWLKPKTVITSADIAPVLARWHDASQFWLAKRGDHRVLSRRARIVTTAADAAAADAAAAAAAAAADAAAADAADVAAAAAAADAAAAAAAAAAADAAAAAAAADAAAADAAAADAAAADDADAAADAADAADWRTSWLRWYVRPHWVLRRHFWWQLAGMTEPSPYAPLVEMYRMGALPIGYVNGEFVVYCPDPAKS